MNLLDSALSLLSQARIGILTIVGYVITVPLLWVGWGWADNVADRRRRILVRAGFVALTLTPTLLGGPGSAEIVPALLMALIAFLPAVAVSDALGLVCLPMLVVWLLAIPIIVVLQRRRPISDR